MDFLELGNVATSSLSYISPLWDALKPILLPVFGLYLGFTLLDLLLDLVAEFLERRRLEEEAEKKKEKVVEIEPKIKKRKEGEYICIPKEEFEKYVAKVEEV
jgi:hypothetical protein